VTYLPRRQAGRRGMETITAEDIVIQPFTFNDIEEIMDIERTSFKDPWSRGMFVREIDTGNFHVLKEKTTNQLLGYFGCWQIFDEFHIINLAVAPCYRRQGIGSLILDHLLDIAKKKNCKRVILEVRSTNVPAQKLYSKFGFEIIGKRKKYYSDGEDALILEKKIV